MISGTLVNFNFCKFLRQLQQLAIRILSFAFLTYTIYYDVGSIMPISECARAIFLFTEFFSSQVPFIREL